VPFFFINLLPTSLLYISILLEWVQEGEDSHEVSATDLQYCNWCGAGSLTMLKCGTCQRVYYCSIDCQKAARSKHKVVCVLKRNMEDVMGLSVGSFAEEEACCWIKSKVRCWRDDDASDAGVLQLVRYLGCLPLALGLASAHARVHGTRVRPSSWPLSSVLCRRSTRSSKSGPKSSCTH
jgi:hypothetical protein